MNYYLFYDNNDVHNDFVVCAPDRPTAQQIACKHCDYPTLVWSILERDIKSCLLPIYTN